MSELVTQEHLRIVGYQWAWLYMRVWFDTSRHGSAVHVWSDTSGRGFNVCVVARTVKPPSVQCETMHIDA